VKLRQHFEWGNVQPTHIVDAVHLLRHAYSLDADEVPDKRLDSQDERAQHACCKFEEPALQKQQQNWAGKVL
jgi:hypothetical protein